MSRRKSRM